MNKSNIFVIAGPTGSGESTITNTIINRFPNCTRLVTATTRKPRNQEKNGIEYFFLEKADFLQKIENGEMLEHTYSVSRDIYYGTLKEELEKTISAGFTIIINPDIVGAKFYKKNYNATSVFIKPESLDTIKDRLLKRQPDMKKEELEKRLSQANEELQEANQYDYIVENFEGQLELAVEKVIEIMKKEGYALD